MTVFSIGQSNIQHAVTAQTIVVASSRAFTRMLLVLFVGLVAMTSGNRQLAGQNFSYDMLVLDEPLQDARYAIPAAMNSWGDMVGNRRLEADPTIQTGFYFQRATESFVYCESGLVLTDINNVGQMVGGDQSVEPDAAIWYPRRGGLWVGGQALYWENAAAIPAPLAPCEGHMWTGAAAINDLGLIVGLSYPNFEGVPAPICAVVWHVAPTGISLPLELPALPDHLYVAAEGISEPNGNGVCTVVGQSGSAIFGDLDEVAVRWRVKINNNGQLVLKEGPVALGTPPGGEAYGNTACASTSNAYVTGILGHDAFKKSKNGTARLLNFAIVDGILPLNGAAVAIDEAKNIVGHQWFNLSPLRRAGDRAILWPQGKAAIDLNNTVELPRRHRLANAVDINASGEILAFLVKEGFGNGRPVILIPRN